MKNAKCKINNAGAAERGLSQSAARGRSDPLATITRDQVWRSRRELGQLALQSARILHF